MLLLFMVAIAPVEADVLYSIGILHFFENDTIWKDLPNCGVPVGAPPAEALIGLMTSNSVLNL